MLSSPFSLEVFLLPLLGSLSRRALALMYSRLPTLRGRGLVPVGSLVDCGEAFESGKNRVLVPGPWTHSTRLQPLLLMSPTDPWEGA